MWLNKDPFDLENYHLGLPYSICLLVFLSAHEFGHYFAAKNHGMKSTLPFYIPVPPFLINPFGTMGAVIRIKSPWTSRKSLFDVGIAGPISGLIIALIILLYGLLTLPDKDYLLSIHPEYVSMQNIPETGLRLGDSIFFLWIRKTFSSVGFIPPMNEIYHYPFLCVGWFGLFVTTLNLIPIGQLDGGHIIYAMIGSRLQGIISRFFFVILVIIGIANFAQYIGWNIQIGSAGWLLWAIILYFIIKLDHPEIPVNDELSIGRKILGWTMFIVFILTFVPSPFSE